MKMNEIIAKINALSKKSKSLGLNEEEKEEQKNLRQEYLKIFKQNFKNQLDNVKIVDKN